MNSLQKQYDKLTPRERIAAMLAAGLRGDDADHAALERAAGKKDWRLPDYYWLSESFHTLAMSHMITMLNLGCAFFMGQGVLYLDEALEKEDRAERIYQGMINAAETIKVNDAAFRMFCKGEGIDPGAALMNYPGSGFYSPDVPELFKGRAEIDTLPSLLRAADIFYPDEPDAATVAELAQVFKDALYRHAGQQSGGWG